MEIHLTLYTLGLFLSPHRERTSFPRRPVEKPALLSEKSVFECRIRLLNAEYGAEQRTTRIPYSVCVDLISMTSSHLHRFWLLARASKRVQSLTKRDRFFVHSVRWRNELFARLNSSSVFCDFVWILDENLCQTNGPNRIIFVRAYT